MNDLIVRYGTYLITGGAGALGVASAEWLIRRGAKKIVLTGRRRADNGIHTALHSLRGYGADVAYIQSDITNIDSVKELIAGFPKLKGIIHCAGVLDDGVISSQTREKIDSVFNPKVTGAINLYKASINTKLDFFIMYSSAAAMLGSAGQSNYSAANSFLNSFAAHLRYNKKIKAFSVCWGPWEGGGMASDSKMSRLSAIGFDILSSDKYFSALENMLVYDIPSGAVMNINWNNYLSKERDNSLFSIYKTKYSTKQQTEKSKKNIANILKEAAAEKRNELMVEYLQEIAAQTLGYNSDYKIPKEKSLMELGFDSMMALALRNTINQDFSLLLPATILFNYPTIEKLTEYFFEEAWNDDSSIESRISEKTGDSMLDDLEKLIES